MSSRGVRILTTCGDAALIQRAAQSLPVPASVESIGSSAVRRLDGADCLIVDVADDARIARATGFEGAIVVLGVPRSDDERESLRMQGTRVSPPGDGDALSAVLADMLPVAGDGAPSLDPMVARTRRLIAAGELSITLRHAINNPLAALMAEVQLLQIDAADDDTRAAAGRMLELVRRLTEVSRMLESVRDR